MFFCIRYKTIFEHIILEKNSKQKNLLSKDSSVKVDGENLYSQHLTTKDAILQRKKLTEYLFQKISSYFNKFNPEK